MDKTARLQLATTLDDLRRWAIDCAQIRQVAATLPVSGPTPIAEDDDRVLALVEAGAAETDTASTLLRPGWLPGRRKDDAPAAAGRASAAHDAATARYGPDGPGVVLRWYIERAAGERAQLTAAVQDMRHWRIQAADARRLAAALPISGPTRLAPAEEQLVQAVDGAREDVDIAAPLAIGRGTTVDPAAASAAARRAIDTHTKILAAHGPTGADAVRDRLVAQIANERRSLATAVDAIRTWNRLGTEVGQLAAHLPVSGPTALQDAEKQVIECVEQVAVDLDQAARLLDDTGFADATDLPTLSGAARRVTRTYEHLVSDVGPDRIALIHRKYVDRAASERERLASAIHDLRAWAAPVADTRRIAAHLPMSGAIELEPHEQKLLALLEGVGADVDVALPLSRPMRFPAPFDFTAAHDASHRIAKAHRLAVFLHSSNGATNIRSTYERRAAAERDLITVAIRELGATRNRAAGVLHQLDHLPLPTPGVLDEGLTADLRGLIQAHDGNAGAAVAVLSGEACLNGNCAGSHSSAEQVVRVQALVQQDGLGDAVNASVTMLEARVRADRTHLAAMIADLTAIRREGTDLEQVAAHLPIWRPSFIGEKCLAAITVLAEDLPGQRAAVDRLTVGDICQVGACADDHAAVVDLAANHERITGSTLLEDIRELRAAVDRQRVDDATALSVLWRQMTRWTNDATAIREARAHALAVVEDRVTGMRRGVVQVSVGATTLDLVPVIAADRPILGALRSLKEQSMSRQDGATLTEAVSLAEDFATIREAFDSNWACRQRNCGASHRLLAAGVGRALVYQEVLDRLRPMPTPRTESFELLLDPEFGFAAHLPQGSRPTDLLDADLTMSALERAEDLAFPQHATEAAADFARTAAEQVRAADIAAALKGMDLDVLRKAAGTSVRINPLASAGLRSVWDVLTYSEKYYLESLNGLGESSAISIEQAVRRLHDAVRDDTPVRIDVKKRSERTTRLLEALRYWGLGKDEPSVDEQALAKAFIALSSASTKPQHVLVVARRQAATPSVADLERTHLERRFPELEGDIWDDFLRRPADYFGMITELGFLTEDEEKMHGDLPEEIIEAVRAKELRRDFLSPRLSLRAYQSFGARFVLVQRKALIGDEMGLGKTVEALTIIAHLRATGQTHFVVVCPAAVVSNWVKETRQHTTLLAHRLQGAQWKRTTAAKAWLRNGGVAVVTYDVLAWARDFVRRANVDCAIFDEAHYIKNPSAKRSLEAQDLIDRVGHAVLMTGTPLENSVQEFRTLISYLRPGLIENAPEYLPSQFRKHVAPAYLRRNQEDVLTELPELVEVDEWLPMSEPDQKDYRAAVEASHFMMMRRAAMLSSQSTKLGRLVEIVAEAEANDRRVIVFSYFREVLDAVERALPGKVFGPLTGAVAAAKRQTMVDDFSKAAGGAVLVAQIGAGGVGLNIQSASVVVICEPQLKPTTENQAIARAHRMGQNKTVQVHRLLTEHSVDERIREIMAKKRDLFDSFARDSVIAAWAPDAVDVSDAELAKLVVAAERERLLGTA